MPSSQQMNYQTKDSFGLLNWESHVEKVAADEKNTIKVYSDINKHLRSEIADFTEIN